MAQIAFIGLGNMGGPMARNLLAAGHGVAVFDLSPTALAGMAEAGARVAGSSREAAEGAEVVITACSPLGPMWKPSTWRATIRKPAS